jgi:hypothetical protein
MLNEDILTGMSYASRNEQKDMLLKEHYGLAILGADVAGRLEDNTDLEKKIEKYARKGRLAYISVLVSDKAMEKMIRFLSKYKEQATESQTSGPRYGGAFWPRYEGEGAGCSAYAVSFLDLAGLLKSEYEEWMVRINIPMDLIGGPYNEGNDVRLRNIRKYDKWADGPASDSSSFEPFEIYDPYLVYLWINEAWEQKSIDEDLPVVPLEYRHAKGIRIDLRDKAMPEDDPLFKERERNSIFIDVYEEKYQSGN